MLHHFAYITLVRCVSRRHLLIVYFHRDDKISRYAYDLQTQMKLPAAYLTKSTVRNEISFSDVYLLSYVVHLQSTSVEFMTD